MFAICSHNEVEGLGLALMHNNRVEV